MLGGNVDEPLRVEPFRVEVFGVEAFPVEVFGAKDVGTEDVEEVGAGKPLAAVVTTVVP